MFCSGNEKVWQVVSISNRRLHNESKYPVYSYASSPYSHFSIGDKFAIMKKRIAHLINLTIEIS